MCVGAREAMVTLATARKQASERTERYRLSRDRVLAAMRLLAGREAAAGAAVTYQMALGRDEREAAGVTYRLSGARPSPLVPRRPVLTGRDVAAMAQKVGADVASSTWGARLASCLQCGHTWLGFDASGAPVLGRAGVQVSKEARCGVRWCGACASAMAKRNARRIDRAMAQLDKDHRRALKGRLSLERAADEDRENEAAAFLREQRPDGRLGFFAEVERRFRRLEDDELAREWGEDAVIRAPWAGTEDRQGPAVLASSVSRAQRRARRRLVVAVEREHAAAAMSRAQKRLAAARLALSVVVSLEGDGVGVVDAALLPTRDRARLPAVQARAAAGERRAAASLARLTAMCDRRRRRDWERRHRRAVVEVEDATAGVQRARKLMARAGEFRKADVRLVTLTQRGVVGESAEDALNRLKESLVKLQRSRRWRAMSAGAFVKIEVEWSTPDTRAAKVKWHLARAESAAKEADADEHRRAAERLRPSTSWATSGCWWHVHAHMLASTGLVDLPAFSAVWRECGGGGVDVRRPRRGVAGVVDEVTKYVTKVTTSRPMPVARLAELMDACRGRRLLWATGCFRGVVLDEERQHDEVVNDAESREIAGRTPAGDVVKHDEVEWDDSPAIVERHRVDLEQRFGRRRFSALSTADMVT